ncbi:MAG: glycoside hydrolase family 38 C-terminal domain-containing protein [Gemmatimonadales bacterium]
MTGAPKQAFVVSHTHWDREWYLTYDRFRVRLVGVVGEVLDALEQDPEFRHFLLDGQAIILEDYLQACPADRERIERLVRANELSIGPWYILPDEFLVSAEATVRNLVVGHRICRQFGGVQKVGYMPDSFGHIAQMPQILRQAGIDSFIYTRGNGAEIERTGYEYIWQAPDGSEVLAINQCGGYCNAGGLGHREEWEVHTQRAIDVVHAVHRIRELFAKMAELSQGQVYLINNGCDHFPPQRDFSRIMEALRREFPDTDFRHASLSEYLEAVRDAGFVESRHTGELDQGRLHHILSGVWSSRTYLKQTNDYAQILLTHAVEPWSAYTHYFFGRPYQSGLIDRAWKLLLQNHPHDSICGCSTDEVHRQMESRFSSVIGTGEQILCHQLKYLAPTFARIADEDRETAVCVANTLPEARVDVVERLVVLRQRDVAIERLRLFDQDGNEVSCEIADVWYMEPFWGVDYRTELYGPRQLTQFEAYKENFGDRISSKEIRNGSRDCLLAIRFLAENLPGLGHRQFFLREKTGVETSVPGTLPAGSVTVSDNTVENEFYRVTLHSNGSFDLEEKATGHVYTGLNKLEDTEDIGDEYDYSPCAYSQTVESHRIAGEIRVLKGGRLWGQLEAECVMSLPVAINPDRQRRSPDVVDCRVCTRVGLRQGSRAVEVELDFDNQAKDHRLRAEFPTGIVADTVVSDGHFYINHRPVDQASGEGWRQAPSGTYPQQSFSLIQDGQRGLAVLNRGLPEIQAKKSESGEVTLALTLFRSVGWLSRDDFETRGYYNAGPTLHTPDAQCLGKRHYEYAVVAFSGSYLDADVMGIAQRYKVPLLCAFHSRSCRQTCPWGRRVTQQEFPTDMRECCEEARN